MNELLNSELLSIWNLLGPWAAIIGSIIVGMWIRDWSTGFAKGARFRMSKSFNEGDKVLLDGCPALIIKIGFTESVFGVYNKDGYTWRYVQNERIPFLKLEKIVDKDLLHKKNGIRLAELEAKKDGKEK